MPPPLPRRNVASSGRQAPFTSFRTGTCDVVERERPVGLAVSVPVAVVAPGTATACLAPDRP